MAKGKKTGGSDFKPGNTTGKGRPRLPDDIKEARKLTQFELERIVNKYVYLSRTELRTAIEDPSTPMLEIMVASIIAQAAQKGDQIRLDFILNRVIGKVQDRIEMKTVEPFVITRRNGEQVLLGAKAKEEDEDKSA